MHLMDHTMYVGIYIDSIFSVPGTEECTIDTMNVLSMV